MGHAFGEAGILSQGSLPPALLGPVQHPSIIFHLANLAMNKNLSSGLASCLSPVSLSFPT